MGSIRVRASSLAHFATEALHYGFARVVGPIEPEVVFILDGVGRFQFCPLLVRRAIREEQIPIGTILVDWQTPLIGEIWTDLMWLRRNRVMGAKLARQLLAFRREHPAVKIHVLAFSGGAGIAVFAGEVLADRRIIETLILAAPALSRDYNLAPTLHCVERCFTLVSERDNWILGVGTRLFGTMDRSFSPAAGKTGFRIPHGASAKDICEYNRLREIYWSRAMRHDGHLGGHTDWASVGFLRKHLLPLLRGHPLLPCHPVKGDKPGL